MSDEISENQEIEESVSVQDAPAEEALQESVEQPAEDDWKSKYEDANDLYLRTLAETENFKKRVQRDRQNEKALAAKDAVLVMLPVIDNLERAVKATKDRLKGVEADGGLKQLLEGVELTVKSFEGALTRLQVSRVDCEIGKPFDPNLHQALFQEENAEMDEGSVLEMLQAGFTLGGQVIRPAMVKVSRKP